MIDKKDEDMKFDVRLVKIKEFKINPKKSIILFKDKESLMNFVGMVYNHAERQWERMGGINMFEDSKGYYVTADQDLVLVAEKEK